MVTLENLLKQNFMPLIKGNKTFLIPSTYKNLNVQILI